MAATKCIPVIQRIVENGTNGFLAEMDNAESLADAMIKATSIKKASLGLYRAATFEEYTQLF